MHTPQIVHLVDDTTAGGVMRVLDHIMSAPELSEFAQHSVMSVDRQSLIAPRITADVIVSHLAVRWRALPFIMSLRARHPQASLVHIEHSYTEAFTAENVTYKARFAFLLRRAYAVFDRVVAVSEGQGDWLRRSGAVKARALRVIRSCVDLSAFHALERPEGVPRVIGAIGRLDRQKGFDTLIKAFSRIHSADIALHIYGEGAEEASLRALAQGDPRIRFMGFQDPVKAMAAVDVVAMPSRWEAYGLVAIEALAAGRRLIVSDIDGLQDHISFGARAVSGQLVWSWQCEIEALSETPKASAAPHSVSALEPAFVQGWKSLVMELLPQDRAAAPEQETHIART